MLKRRVRFYSVTEAVSHLISASGLVLNTRHTNLWETGIPEGHTWCQTDCTADSARYYWLQDPPIFLAGVLRFWSPKIPAWHMKISGEPKAQKLRSVADLAFPRVSGLGDVFGLTPNEKAGQFTSSLVADTSPYTHTHPNTRTHPFTLPQASGLLCNINLTFIYSLLWEICAISANQAPNKPYMAFSVSASHLNVECLFQPTKLMRKR